MPKSDRGTGARRPRFFTEPTPGGNQGGGGQGNGGGRPDRPGRPGQGGHQGGGNSGGGSPSTLFFIYTGANQTFNLPANASSYIDVDLAGSNGGSTDFGAPYNRGARVQCRLAMTPNTSATVVCGGIGVFGATDTTNAGGFNGGGAGNASNFKVAGGGGGATDIRIGGTALSDRKVVGGGGGGYANNQITGSAILAPGAGGYTDGTIGVAGYGGGGGTQSAGGGGGDGPGAGAAPGTAGVLGVGGDGSTYAGNTGGGGGGGYYGGGGGGVRSDGGNGGGTGGGGSSWTHASDATLVTHTNAYNNGPGYCYITYYSPTPLSGYADSDTFTRADSVSNLGSTANAVAWSQLHGTWGISSNEAYRPSGSGGFDGTYAKGAVVETSNANGTLSVGCTLGTNSTGCGITFRAVDGSNGWIAMAYRDGSGNPLGYLIKHIAGVATYVLSSLALGAGNTGTLQVKINGSIIELSWKGVVVYRTVDSQFSTATKHGLCDFSNIGDSNRLDTWSFTTLWTPPT